MAPSLVATTTAATSGTTVTINVPVGAVAGDVLVLALRHQNSTLTKPYGPAGWTLIGAPFVAQSPERGNQVYALTVTGTAPASVTIDATQAGRQVATMHLVRGVTLDGVKASSYSGIAITNGRALSGLTSGTTQAFAIAMAASEFAAGAVHVPTTYPNGWATAQEVVTGSDTAVARTYMWTGTKIVTANAAVDASITWPAATTSGAMQAVALPVAGATPAPDPTRTGLAISRVGQGAAKLYTVTTAGVRTPSEVRKVLPGYSSVTAMLRQKPFHWAHRGGSASYPEHSLFAYTQAAMRGFGALEVSLARTSDGVWFGNHDADLSRVTGGASTAVPSTLTWAQVQQLNIVTGAVGAPKPFMKVDDLLAVYGKTHVIVLDPKYTPPEHMAEFWALCDKVGKDRCVVKFYYTATTIADEARKRGFTTWGYVYESDYTKDPTWQAKAAKWDILGMEYFASQSAWDQIKALGKPVIGHICPDQAAVEMAISKGAAGVQVSGVAKVRVPRMPQ